MKTITKPNNTFDFLGCTKSITVNGVKTKVVYDRINFNRNDPKFICEYDLYISGRRIGKVSVPYSDLFLLDGIEFNTDKKLMEYAITL